MQKIIIKIKQTLIALLFAFSVKAQTYGAGTDVYTYSGLQTILYGNSNTTYKWTPSRGLSSDTVANPTVTVTDTTQYVLRYTIPGDTTHYYDTAVVYIVSPAGPNSIASCTNVVNNGDFETTNGGVNAFNGQGSGPPTAWPDAYNASSADYYSNTLSPINTGPCYKGFEYYGSPASYTGHGNSFAGITIGAKVANVYQEYLEQKICPLLTGQAYTISFDAAWAPSCNYACGTLGMLLSSSHQSPSGSNLFISGSPQLTGSCGSNSNWQTFSTTYTAAGGESYVTIGQFGAQAICSAVNTNGPNDNVIYNYIDNVIISPISPTVTASQTVICQGQVLYLTETGSPSANCTWYDPNGTNIGTGNYIGAYATVSGNYSVTVNPGCSSCSGYSSSIYISVTPTVPITVTGASTVCLGSPITFTASCSGATSFTWNPSGHVGAVYTSTVFTSGAQTYTVESNNCGYATKTFTVEPLPTITAVASPTIVCVGSTSTLTASGASTYTWSPGSITGASITVTPTVTSTYTVTGTGSLSCTNTKTVTVTVPTQTCTGTQPSYTINSSGTYSPTTGFIAQNMYIGSGTFTPSYTINCANVTIAPNVTITVHNGATLVITGSWLHACGTCSYSMWQGIKVENGGNLIINNYSIIEDAYSAVKTALNASTTPVPNYTITNSIFNNNDTAIYLQLHHGDLSANTLYNTVFTCRSLNSHTVTSTNFNNTKKDIHAATPIHTSTLNPTDNTLSGNRARYGVYANLEATTTNINIGTGTVTPNTLFDNLDFGIYAKATNIVSKNCRFQNLTGNTYTTTPIGVGIYADEGDDFKTSLQAGNASVTIDNTERDTFINCMAGIYTSQLNKILVNNNYFNNETTASTFTTLGSYVTGQFGIYNKAYAALSGTATPEQMIFANNNVNNYATGFLLDFAKLYNTTGQSTLISTNTITATGTSTLYCNYGITAQQGGATNGGNTGVIATACYIGANTITNVNTSCVNISSVNNSSATSGILTVDKNTELSIKPNTYTAIQSPRIAAVRVDNSYYTAISNNTNIRCTGTTGTVTPGQWQAGIYVTQSPHTGVVCNTMNNIGEGMVFESTNPTGVYTNNISRNNFDYCKYGFVLRNGGICGDQGSAGNPHDNIWAAQSHFTAQTLSDHSDPSTGTTSKLYCRAATTCTVSTNYLPCTNFTVNPVAVAYTNSVTLLATTGTSSQACASDGGGGGGGGRMAASNIIINVDSLANIDSAYYQNIQSTIGNTNYTYPFYDTETRWALQHYVSSAAPYLLAAGGYENAKTLALVDAALANSNYNIASTLINSFNSTNIIESNWQTVNNILAKMQATDTLGVIDVSSLQQVAAQCHLSGGSIVFRARAMLNAYYGTVLEYPNACSVNNGDRVLNTTSINSIANNQSINLYPNPNNGKMILEYNLLSNALLQITDVTGKAISSYRLNATEKSIEINNEILQNGVYLYTVINEQGLIKTGRVVIMK